MCRAWWAAWIQMRVRFHAVYPSLFHPKWLLFKEIVPLLCLVFIIRPTSYIACLFREHSVQSGLIENVVQML